MIKNINLMFAYILCIVIYFLIYPPSNAVIERFCGGLAGD